MRWIATLPAVVVAWAWTLSAAASSPPLFLLRYSRDTLHDGPSPPQRLGDIRLATDAVAFGGRVRLMAAASAGSLSTTATAMSSKVVVTTCGDDATSVLFMDDAPLVKVERVLQALWFAPAPSSAPSDGRCGDRAFRPPRVDVWIQPVDPWSPRLTCADLQVFAGQLGFDGVTDHHVKRISLLMAPASIQASMDTVRVRASEEIMLHGLNLQVPEEDMVCSDLDLRQRFRLRVSTAAESGGKLVLRRPIQNFLSGFLTSPDVRNQSNLMQLDAASDYIRLMLRSLTYTAPSRDTNDTIRVDLWTIGATDEHLQSVRLAVTVVQEATPVQVTWNNLFINTSRVFDMDEDSSLSLAGLSIRLPSENAFENLVLNATLTATHGMFEVPDNDSGRAGVVTRQTIDDASTIQISGMQSDLNRFVQQLTFQPTHNYNGPEAIVISVAQNASSSQDSMANIIQPTSEILRVFLHPVEDAFSLEWADAHFNSSSVIISPSTKRQLPPVMITDGEEEENDCVSSPFFTYQGFLRAEVEAPALSGVGLHHDAVQPTRTARDGRDFVQLTFDGTASGLMALLSSVELVAERKCLPPRGASSVVVRVTRVDVTNESSLSGIEAYLTVTVEGSSLSQLFSQQEIEVQEDEPADLGGVFTWAWFNHGEYGDAGFNAVVWLAVSHGHVASNSSVDTIVPQRNLTFQATSVGHLKSALSQLTYFPDKNFAGDDKLVLSVDNETANLWVRVLPVNDPPTVVVEEDSANVSGFLPLRTFVPRIKVDDPDTSDWLTLELAIDLKYEFVLLDPTDAVVSGLQVLGTDPESWTMGAPLTTDTLRVRGSIPAINHFFSDSFAVEILDDPAHRDQAATLRICIFDEALLSECVTRSVRLPVFDSLVRFSSASIPPLAFGRPMPASVLMCANETAIPSESVVSMRLTAQLGSFVTPHLTEGLPKCGLSTEQQYDSGGSTHLVRELTGRWGCVCELLRRSLYRGPSIVPATPTIDSVSMELWHSTRRLVARSFTIPLLPPTPRFKFSVRNTSSHAEGTGISPTEPPLWRWVQARAAALQQFVEINITSVVLEDTVGDEDETEVENRLLALNVSCSASCLVRYSLDTIEGAVPSVDYSFADRNPSHLVQFFGTRQSLTLLLSTIEIRASNASAVVGDGYIDVALAEVDNSLYETAVASTRVVFRFEVSEPPLHWLVVQPAFASAAGADVVRIDGVSLTGDTLDAPQRVHVVVECDGATALSMTIHHPAVRIVDRPCGRVADHTSIKIADSLATVNSILRHIQVQRRDLQTPRQVSDDATLRFAVTRDGMDTDTSTEVQLHFKPALASHAPLTQRLLTATNTTRAVDEDSSTPLGEVFAIQDADGDDRLHRMTAAVSHGVLSVPLDDVCCIHIISAVSAKHLVVEGTLSSLRDAIAAVHYSPLSEFSGRDVLQVAIEDENRIATKWTLEMAIHVRAVNDAPRIVVHQARAEVVDAQRTSRNTTTLYQTEVSIHITDVDLTNLLALGIDDITDKGTPDPSIVRVRLGVSSSTAFMILPHWKRLQESLTTPSFLPVAAHGQQMPNGLSTRSLTFDAPADSAKALLSSVLFMTPTRDLEGAIGEVDDHVLEIYVSDLGHGRAGWEPREAAERVRIDSDRRNDGHAPIGLTLPPHHASVDTNDRKLTIAGLSLTTSSTFAGEDRILRLDQQDDDNMVRVTGTAAFRVVPEVQRIRLLGPEQVQILTVRIQISGGVDVVSVAGTFRLQVTDPATNQVKAVNVYAQAVAMRVDEVVGDEGTGRGQGESIEASFASMWGNAKVHVVKTVAADAATWQIYSVIASAGNALPVPLVTATAFSGVGVGGAVTVVATSDVQAATLGGLLVLRLGDETTRGITADAIALEMQDALEELTAIRVVQVSSVGVGAFTWDVTFFQPGANVPLLEGDVAMLTPVATVSDAAWPTLTSSGATVEITRITEGVGQGPVYEINIGGTHVSPVYSVGVTRAAVTLSGGSFAISFRSLDAMGMLLATTDAIAFDAVAMASDEAVLIRQEGGRVGNSMESKLQNAIQSLPQRHWSAATRVVVSRVTTVSPLISTWTITFVDAPSDFPTLQAVISAAQPPLARLTVAVAELTASNTIGGSFALSFRDATTTPLAVSSTAAIVQDRLHALDAVRNASLTFGRVLVRRKEMRAVGGASFAVLFVEHTVAAGSRLLVDGGALTGVGTFARVKSFPDALKNDGSWVFPAIASLPLSTSPWARGVQGLFTPSQFELRGAAADVRVWLQQVTYIVPSDWSGGWVSAVVRAERVGTPTLDSAVLQTEEQLLPFQALLASVVVVDDAVNDVAVTRGQQHNINVLRLHVPSRARGLLWLRVRARALYGTVAVTTQAPPTASAHVWLNGTAEAINRSMVQLHYASTRSSDHAMDVLSIDVLSYADSKLLTQSEYLLRVEEAPFEPRVAFNSLAPATAASDDVAVVASDDAPLAVRGVTIVDANAVAGVSSARGAVVVVDLHVQAALGRVFFTHTDGLLSVTAGDDAMGITLRGSVVALNEALASLQYESSCDFTHTRDTITVRTVYHPEKRPLMTHARALKVEIRHAVHVPRVRLTSSLSDAVAFAAKEDTGFQFPNLTLEVGATATSPRRPLRRHPRAVATELRRTELQPPSVTTRTNVSPDDDPRHRWVADLPGLSSTATIAVFPTGAAGGGNRILFTGTDRTFGEELWVSDGSPNGTQLVADLAPGNASACPSDFAVLPSLNRLIFAADGIDRSWILDTPKACNRERTSSTAADLLYVVAASTTWDPSASYECPHYGWRWATTRDASARFSRDSSRTPANLSEPYVFWGACDWHGFVFGGATRRHFRFADSAVTGALKHAGRRDSAPLEVSFATADFAGIVCIRDDDGAKQSGSGSATGRELWITDGGAATQRLADMETGPRGSNPQFLTLFQSRWIVFQATTAALGAELFKTDGTSSGTVLVEDIWRGPRSSSPSDLCEWTSSGGGDGRLYFAATTDAGRELWSTDGLSSQTVERGRRQASTAVLVGTTLVKDICAAGSGSSDPQFLTPLGAIGVFFAASDCVNGRELWVTDGTLAGTKLVRDLNPVSGQGSEPSHLVAFNGKLYFAATAGASMGQELFVSDGTATGTLLLLELVPGVESAAPSLLTVANARLYFYARDAQGVGNLWVSDGTAAGTTPVWDAPFAQSHVVPFTATRGRNDKLVVTANALYYFTQRRATASRSNEHEDQDDDRDDDRFLLQITVNHGRLSVPPERPLPLLSLTVNGTRRRLQDVLVRVLYHPPLNWNVLQTPEDHVVQWNFTVSSLASPAVPVETTLADLIVRPQIDPPVIIVPTSIEHATRSARDYLSRQRLECGPMTVLEDVATPLRGFSVRGVDDLDGGGRMATWDLELAVTRGRLDLATDAAGCVHRLTVGQLTNAKHIRLTTTTGVACLDRLLRKLTYTSDPNASGFDALTIRVALTVGVHSASDVAVVPLVVTEINDAPFLTSASGLFFYEADEDEALVLDDLHIKDPDAVLGTQRVRMELQVRYGSIALLARDTKSSPVVVQQNTSAAWTPASSTRLVVSGSLSDLNAALARGLSYTSAPDWNSLAHTSESDGYDVVSIDLSDGQAFNASTLTTLYVFVRPTPDAVVVTRPTMVATSTYAALGDSSSALHGDEDAWLETSGLAFTSQDDTSRASLDVTLRVAHGRLAMDATVLRSHGVSTSGSAEDGSAWRLRGRFAHVTQSVSRLRYLPALDFNGDDALEIIATAMDDYVAQQQSIQTTLVVPIHVHAVNDPPQWTLPASRLHWKQDGATRIVGVKLYDADAASIECAADACSWGVVLEATGSGVLTLPYRKDVATNYVVLSGSLPQLNRALREIVLTTSDADRLIHESVDVWFTADDRGAWGSGGPHVTRQRLVVVTPLQRTHHALTLVAPHDSVLATDEDTALVFRDGAIRLRDRDASTRSVAASPLYEVTIESRHGTFQLAVSRGSAARLIVVPSSSGRVLRIRGFLLQLNAALNGSAYMPDRDWFGSDELRISAAQIEEEEDDAAMDDATEVTLFVFVTPVCDAPRWRPVPPRDLQADLVLDEDSHVLVTSLVLEDPDSQETDAFSSGLDRHVSVAITVHDGGGVLLATTHGLRLTDASTPSEWTAPAFAALRLLFFSRVTLTGRVADLNAALCGLVYRPLPDFHTSGHVRDAVTLQTFASLNATCGSPADDPTTATARTVRVQIVGVHDPPRVDSPRFQQVTAREDLDRTLVPTLEAVAGQDQTLDPITLVDVDMKSVDNDLAIVRASMEPTVRLRVSCYWCTVRPTMTLETLQQTHSVVASYKATTASEGAASVWTYYAPISTLNTAVLSSLVFTSDARVPVHASVIVLLEIADDEGTGRRETAFAMGVRVRRVNVGPQILVPPYGTQAPPLHVDEHGSVLLQGAPPLPPPLPLTASNIPTWQLLHVNPRGANSRARVRSLLDVVSLNGRAALASYAMLSPTQLVFSATTATTGTELWTSDGTTGGTMLLKDLLPGPRDASPRFLTRVSLDNRVYFAARAPNTDDWRLRVDLRDACDGFRESAFAPGVFFAVAQDATAWTVDETYDCPVGFQWMTTAEAAAVFVGVEPRDGHASEPLVYFDQCGWQGYDWGGHTRTHFRFADSGRTGAFKHAGHRDSYRPDVGFETLQFAGIVCRRFLEYEQERIDEYLWSTDGTREGTRRTTRVATQPQFLTEFRGRLFFQATTDADGSELWASDGDSGASASSSSTQLIADIAPGPRSSTPEQLTVVNDQLFFSAAAATYGRELWVSDGDLRADFAQVDKGASSATATRLVRDIQGGAASSQPRFLTALPAMGLLLFQADDGVHGPELWKSDGSASGTALVLDICTGARGSQPRFLTLFHGRVFFQADDGVRGAELWVSDGTAATTQLLVDLVAGAHGAAPRYLSVLTLPSSVSVASVLVFAAAATTTTTGVHDPQAVEFYTSDGTSSGTHKLFPASLEPLTLNDAAMDAVHDGRARLLAVAGGFVVFGQKQQQQMKKKESLTSTLVTVSRSLTLVDNDRHEDTGSRNYSVALRTERGGVLSLPHRLACGSDGDETNADHTSVMVLRGSLPQLNCLVAQVVYEATSPVSTAVVDGWNDAIVVTLTEDESVNNSEDDDGRAYAVTQRVPVRVTALNHAPVITMPARVAAPLDVWTPLPLIQISDEDAGDAAMLLLRVAVQRGRVRLVDAADVVDADGLTVLGDVDPHGRAALEVAGSLTALNTALLRQRVQYACLTVDGCVAGDRAVVAVTVDDNGFSGSGGAQSTTQTLAVGIVG